MTGLAFAIAMFVASLTTHDERLYRAAVLLAILAATGLLCCRAALTDALIERVRQEGYDDGYADGCEVRRPEVVKLLPETTSGRGGLPFRRAPHQFGQKHDIRC